MGAPPTGSRAKRRKYAVMCAAPFGRPPRSTPDERRLDRRHRCPHRPANRQVAQAVMDYNMIEEGDRIMVCMSGGKDSYGMRDVLLKMQQRAHISFSIVAVNLDLKQPGFPDHILPEYLKGMGVEFHIERPDTFSIVKRSSHSPPHHDEKNLHHCHRPWRNRLQRGTPFARATGCFTERPRPVAGPAYRPGLGGRADRRS